MHIDPRVCPKDDAGSVRGIEKTGSRNRGLIKAGWPSFGAVSLIYVMGGIDPGKAIVAAFLLIGFIAVLIDMIRHPDRY